VTGGEAALFEELLNWRLEFQEADGVRDGRAVFPGTFRNLLLSQMELIDEALKGVGLLDWVQIFTLEIFHQGHFQREFLGHIAKYDRNTMHAGTLGGAPTAFAGDELIAVRDSTDYEWLDDTARLNGPRKLVESFFAEARTRLIRTGIYEIDINVQEPFTQGRRYRRPRRCPQRVNRRDRRLLLRLRQRCGVRLPNQCSQSPA
jgi:hypothetical protein